MPDASGNARDRRSREQGESEHPRILAVTFMASVGVGALSLLMRPTYDESFWLAIARRVALGGDLYRDAIDNKTPFVYGLSWLLDVAPGPYVLARSVLVAGITAGVIWLVFRLTRADSQILRGLLAVTAALVLVLQNQLAYTTEFVAVLLLLISVAFTLRGEAVTAVAFAVLAAAFDPRSLLMMPGIVALTWQTAGAAQGRRALLTALIAFTVGVGVVLAMPDLRFALVEFNLASRPSPTLTLLFLSLFTALRNTLPLLMLSYLLRKRGITPDAGLAEVLLLIGAVLIGGVSIQPFDHYWGYVVVPTPLLWRQVSDSDLNLQSTRALLALSLVPLTAVFAVALLKHSATERQYARVAGVLRSADVSYVSIDDQPYLPAMLPTENLLRSPVLDYLVRPSSRQDGYLDELPTLVKSADVLVDDGILSAPESAVTQSYRRVWKIFMNELPSHECQQMVGTIALHFRCVHDDKAG